MTHSCDRMNYWWPVSSMDRMYYWRPVGSVDRMDYWWRVSSIDRMDYWLPVSSVDRMDYWRPVSSVDRTVSGAGVSCWTSSSASRAPGVFGGQALPWSEFLVIVPSTACCRTMYCTRLIRTRIIVCSVSCHHFLPEFDIAELVLHLMH